MYVHTLNSGVKHSVLQHFSFSTKDRERGPFAWFVREFHSRVRSVFWISFIPSRGRSFLVFVRRSPFSFCFASVFLMILLPERTGSFRERIPEFRHARRSAFGIPFGDPVSRVARVIPEALSSRLHLPDRNPSPCGFRRERRSDFGIPFGDPVSRVARVIPRWTPFIFLNVWGTGDFLTTVFCLETSSSKAPARGLPHHRRLRYRLPAA